MKFFLLTLLISTAATAATELNIESGVVQNSYNRVAIPGDDGTGFNLSKSVNGSYGYHRISLSHKFNDKHGARFLYAPLRLSGSAIYSKNIDFGGDTFSANTKTNTEYQFNSYRASYFYQWKNDEKWNVRIGPTLKVRDAKVNLSQPGVSKFKKNSGIVPLLYFFAEYKFAEKFRAAFDFDGWAAPQGRAFDAGLMVGYYFRDNMHFNVGYRILEGGADNDNVYNFSKLDYYLASLQVNF